MTDRVEEIEEIKERLENTFGGNPVIRELKEDIRRLLAEVERLQAERDDARGWFAQVALSRAFEDREQGPVPDFIKPKP